MSQELSEPRPEVLALRRAMDRVRAIQEASGLAISLARYDAETEPINSKFMEDFLEILPIELEYSRNTENDRIASSLIVKDALNVRPTAVFGAHILRTYFDSGEAGLVIGERSSLDPKQPVTELLILGLRRPLNQDKTWGKSYPAVTPLTVATERWEELRRTAIDSLSTPYSQDTFKHLFSSAYSGYLIDKSTVKDTGIIQMTPIESWRKNKDAFKHLKRASKEQPSTLNCQTGKTRRLQSSDIELYGVMTHLEYITAAFDKSADFDAICAKRANALPGHPVDTALEEPQNRQALDAALGQLSLQKHPSEV